MRRLTREPGISLERCDEAFAQYRGREREPVDRKPVEHDADRDVRNLEVLGPWCCRRRGARSRHIDFGEAERPDVQLPRQQRRRRDIEPEIMHGNIGPVAVADLDLV